MAFVEYNLGNNLEGIPLGNAFGDTDLTLQVGTGRGATFKDKDGVALTNFPLTVEFYNSDNVVTKRETILVELVDGDILKGITRQYESCVQNDTVSPKLVTNNSLDFGLSSVFVSVRKTARQEDNVRDEIILKANDNEVVKIDGPQTINDVKTFSTSPVMPTAPQDDNSTNGATTEYVDRAILSGASNEELINEDFYMGQDGQTGKIVFPEQNITSTDADQTQNIGDVAGNTRVAVRVFGSSVVDNLIDCKLGADGSPTTDLEFRLETIVAGQPSGTLVSPNATDSLTTAEVGNGVVPILGYSAISSYEDEIVDTITYTSTTTSSLTEGFGFKIKANRTEKLQTVVTHPTCTATRCRLFDSNYSLLDTQTIVNNTATFDYKLRGGSLYFIEVDNSGAPYTRIYNNVADSYPSIETGITLIEPSQDGATEPFTHNILSIGTAEANDIDLGLTEGVPYRLVMNQTGDTVNASNYFTIGFSNKQTNTRILSTYDGSSYSAPFSFSDDFEGTTINTSKRTVTDPVGGEATITQSDGLTMECPRDATGERGNIITASISGAIALTTELGLRINNFSDDGSKIRLEFDSSNYAEIELQDNAANTNVLLYRVYEAGSQTQSGSLAVGETKQKLKIFYELSGDIGFYYWGGSSRTQLGSTFSTTLSGNHIIKLTPTGQSSSTGLLQAGLYSYIYATSNDFTSEIPVITTGTNFVYLNSGLFLDQILSCTDASLSYKTKKPYILKSNYSIGSKALVGFDGINNNQSEMTPGAIQYLSDTPGEIDETPGTNKFQVGEALTDTGLRYEVANLVSTTETIGASPYTYQNEETNEQKVMITGGTVSSVQYSRDGSTFFTQGTSTNTEVILGAGDYVKITYSSAPTFTTFNK